jgi:hypothetical protein
MFNLSGLIAVALLRRLDDVQFRRIVAGAAIFLIVTPIVHAAVVKTGTSRQKPMRVLWPQADIAERFNTLWHQATNAPLRIVGGERWVAGLVGLENPDEPSVYTDLNSKFAPWITPERLAEQGLLVVWREQDGADLSMLPASLTVTTRTFEWSKTSPPIQIRYAIALPRQQSQ